MKKALVGALFVLSAALAAGAQEANSRTGTGQGAATAWLSSSDLAATAPFDYSEAHYTATVSVSGGSAAASFPEKPASPAPKPKFVFGDRDDYRFQLGVGIEFFRFQSSVYSATLVGTNTTLTYFTNSWFALEGDVVTGFAPEIYVREHVKYVAGAGGIRIGGRRLKWEPWGHVLVGGGHLQPQTAGSSKTALTLQTGLGVDYRLNSRVSLRAGADYVYTRFFSQNQHNIQGATGIVFHF